MSRRVDEWVDRWRPSLLVLQSQQQVVFWWLGELRMSSIFFISSEPPQITTKWSSPASLASQTEMTLAPITGENSIPGRGTKSPSIPLPCKAQRYNYIISFSLRVLLVFWCTVLTQQNSSQAPVHIWSHPFCARYYADSFKIDYLSLSSH